MGDVKKGHLAALQPRTSERGHPMPRRATPETSVTLRHHRLARDASMRPEPASNADPGSSARRNSSGDSHVTGHSDPKNWFDLSNRNAPTAFDSTSMDVDPPFFQKQSDSSNEEMNPPPFPLSAYRSQHLQPPMAAHSSSADDYRSVIDDLTVENRRLKDELKRFKQYGPDLLRKDKLFEIKFHGLPKKKKRELEMTLRDFASSLEGSTTSSQQRKQSNHISRLQGSSSNSKHESMSSSHSRPIDSAYASMSNGASSSGQYASGSSIGRPSLGRARSTADSKVESFLKDIPEGLLPRQRALTDKEKKKLVVRRLEYLFTGGKLAGRNKIVGQSQPVSSTSLLKPQMSAAGVISAPPLLAAPPAPQDEPSREARIQELHECGKKSSSREELSTINSNADNDTRENRTGSGSGSGSNEHSGQDSSPQNADLPEQRATRPLDLDPDRVQVPSDNMQYIRHLGVTAPEYVSETKFRHQDVSMDAEGWIHLNLLCNLAQLHILNVTPGYIRSAVTERSAKFQLSRDGRKIRWRGGTEGTRFSSDSSGENSQRSPDTTEATDEGNEDGQRKRQKTTTDPSAVWSKSHTKRGPRGPPSSESFHYKPMFVHQQSSSADTSLDESVSQASFPVVENSNMNSRSTGIVSGSGSSPQKKRRRDGAIIYYTGAPFCLDLSGDPGDTSPTTFMTNAGQEQELPETEGEEPKLVRTASGSNLPYRPLVDGPESLVCNDEEYVIDDTGLSEAEEGGFCWCEHPEKPQLRPLEACLEPCGLGGVTPEDHFAVLVVTRHPLMSSPPAVNRAGSADATDAVVSRIAKLTTQSPHTPQQRAATCAPNIQIQTLQQRYKELKPLPLPPPAIFYPPFTETTESDDSGFEDDYEEEDDSDEIVDSAEAISQLANPHLSDNEFARMGGMESEEDDNFDTMNIKGASKVSFAPLRRMSRGSGRGSLPKVVVERHPDSSGATAGEASGYSSGREESG